MAKCSADCVRFAAPSQPEKLETGLYAVFGSILQNDVQGGSGFLPTKRSQGNDSSEFVPYVFQLFAALLEANPAGTLTAYYTSLVQPILSPELWASKGNIPALVRLLSSLLTRGASQIAENNQLQQILAIFQSLITTRANEVYGFELLESIVANFAP